MKPILTYPTKEEMQKWNVLEYIWHYEIKRGALLSDFISFVTDTHHVTFPEMVLMVILFILSPVLLVPSLVMRFYHKRKNYRL